jgi:SAM-dependent methyltransferase
MLRWAEAVIGSDFAEHLVDGYLAFTTDVNESQAAYEETGRYRHSSYADVHDRTYADPAFMKDYHWGVYVTTFAWEHHLALHEFFLAQFLAPLAAHASAPGGRLLELGSGSGIWSILALGALPAWRGRAVDISETSVALSRRMANVAGLSDRLSIDRADALAFRTPEPADAAISCFLAEHLETPGLLFANLAANLAPRGRAFVTVALTAAEIDHIYEFRRESEAVAMAEQAGLRVVAMLSAAPGATPPDRAFLPRSLGLVLERRRGPVW